MNRAINYSFRIAACIVVFLLYLYAWRPVRAVITQKIVHPQLLEAQADTGTEKYRTELKDVSIAIFFKAKKNQEALHYRPQAGFYFLIALMVLILINAKFKWYLLLGGFHLTLTVETALLMILSKNGWYPGFFIVDLQATYLVPAMTLAFAGWVVAMRKNSG